MQTNQNQTSYPVDYLNQIATSNQPRKIDQRFLFIIIGIIVALFIFIAFAIFNSLSSGSKDKIETLAARIITLNSIADESHSKIKSGTLKNANSSLTLLLTNAKRDMKEPMSNNDINTDKLDKKIIEAESGAVLKQKLEDARLNAIFDRTYAREIDYQIETILILSSDIYKSTNSKSLKEFLENTHENLIPVKTLFHDFKN